MNYTIFWLVALVLFIAIEIATMGLTTIWFAGGALLAVLAAALGLPLTVQIVLFFIISFVLLYYTRPMAVKYGVIFHFLSQVPPKGFLVSY